MKAILWDLDGVLVNAADWHFHALNQALREHSLPEISYGLHLSNFNGLSTKVKLDKLGIVDPALRQKVNSSKQASTWIQIQNELRPEIKRTTLLNELGKNHIQGCVTNCIELTANLMLQHSGLKRFMRVLVSNESTTRPKPFPDSYTIAMFHLGVKPQETLAVEDNPNGIKAAEAAGCHVFKLERYDDIEKMREVL